MKLLSILFSFLLLCSFNIVKNDLNLEQKLLLEVPEVIVLPGLLYMCGGDGEVFTDCDKCESCICEIIIFENSNSSGNISTYFNATVTFYEASNQSTAHFDEVIVNRDGNASQCELGDHESAINVTHINY